MSMTNRNSQLLHQTSMHQQSPQISGAASNVIGLGGKPGLYGPSSSVISRPAWKWWRYIYYIIGYRNVLRIGIKY